MMILLVRQISSSAKFALLKIDISRETTSWCVRLGEAEASPRMIHLNSHLDSAVAIIAARVRRQQTSVSHQ